ncbi:MAG: hypothetical protein FWD68_13000 [Alphaproteobacteria bacterium]|nr:hypothetical protein [Alphaproteobacteria bacterium]
MALARNPALPLVAAMVMIASSAWAAAEIVPPPNRGEQVVERKINASPNRDTQIGVYLNVKPDCSSGPLPTIRLSSPPSSGKVVVKRARLKATNYKACLALEVPAYVAFYKSQPQFSGSDAVTIEVTYPQGRTEIQKITVIVGSGNEQKI